jgi:hypothetical protein
MKYATYPDHEQWTAKNCSTGAQFTRDYPLYTYMGMCPGPMWPNCNSPCQPAGAFRGPGHKSNQTQKRYETDEPRLHEPWAFLGEPKPHIRKLAADNYSFDDPDDPTKTYFVRVLTHKLPRGWYEAGRGRPRVPLYADTTLTYGIQIFQPKKSTKIMTVASEGDGIFVLTIGADDVRVITTGTP